MPYCLACGTKTDFETVDCPDCGQAIRRRIDPPGDDVEAVSEPELYWDEDDDGESETVDDAGAADEPPLAGGDETPTRADAGAETARADDGTETARSSDDERSLETDPTGASPFAGRWSLSFATGYPVRRDYRPLVVGSILEFFAVLIPVFTLFTAGYGFRVLRAAARGQDDPPAFEGYGQLLVEGMKFSLVVALYATVAFFGAVGAIVVQAVDEPSGIALWLALGALAVYPLPASLTACGATDEFRTAFTREYAGAFAVSRTYLKAWLAWLVAGVAVAVVAVLSLLTLVGPVVVRTWSIYSFGALWGYYYRAAAARGVVPPAPEEPVS